MDPARSVYSEEEGKSDSTMTGHFLNSCVTIYRTGSALWQDVT
jgi:hypothetical protein